MQTRDDDKSPEKAAKGEGLDCRPQSFPELEPIQSMLERNRVIGLCRAHHERCCLRGDKQRADCEEGCSIDGESTPAQQTLPAEEKDDRCKNTENRSTNLFKWVEDQTICA